MENLNPVQETPTQSFIPPTPIIPTIPKQNNIFKYLFIVCFIVLLAAIASFYLILNNKNSKQSLVKENTDNISKVVPTEIINQTIPIDIPKVNIEYKASFVKDDKNSVSKLVLTDQNQKETVVSETKYFKMNEDIIKPEYRYVFSSDQNYLTYSLSGYEGGFSGVYDIKNKIKIDLPFVASGTNFNDSNTFFYACDEGGISGGGAVIYKLPGLTPVYNKEGSFNCEYNRISNSLIISEDSSSGQKLEQFSFTSGFLFK